ncbi:MAG: transglycosylase SLT domain-containing protein [Bacteroidota bacterium]
MRFLLILCSAVALAACGDLGSGSAGLPPPVDRDLDAIAERDTLVALTTYNSTSYFLYRGEPLGYEYGLLRRFAESQDLTLKMRVVSDSDSLFILLNEGAGDIVASRIVPTAADSADVAFTSALYRTEPILVQRAESELELPDSVDSVIVKGAEAADTTTELVEAIGEAEDLAESVELSARLITQPRQLAGEEVHLPGNSPYEETLVELSDAVTGDIYVVELGGDVSSEELIRQVSAGTVDYTVSQENVADLRNEYYSNITVQPVMGAAHDVAWAVRSNAPDLQTALSAWIDDDANSRTERILYRKYFIDRKGYRERVRSDYLTGETGVLSDYDDLLKKYAAEINWDWRLLASQTYQESRFDPDAQSWAGATGLLQLMPPTAREFGVTNAYDPEDNVAGAVRFIRWLENYWDDRIEDETQRMRFVLASYNTGHGHVEDARRLTVKHGGDDTVWDEVAFWLLQKSKAEVYTDPVVKYGFARGLEPVTYVELILDRYDHYRQFVTGDGDAALAGATPQRSAPNVQALERLAGPR